MKNFKTKEEANKIIIDSLSKFVKNNGGNNYLLFFRGTGYIVASTMEGMGLLRKDYYFYMETMELIDSSEFNLTLTNFDYIGCGELTLIANF